MRAGTTTCPFAENVFWTYWVSGSDEGKKLTAADGLRVVATLVRCRLTKV